MELELKGKTAIVTGGSRGIGKAIGREFGLEGMDVALVARGQEALEETARELAEETGANFITIVADTITASGITICPRPRTWSRSAWMEGPLMPSLSLPRPGSRMCSTA